MTAIVGLNIKNVVENKYYKPTIEEFCVGFEYEHLTGSNRMVMINFSDNTSEQLTEPKEHWINHVFNGREFDEWDSSFKFDSALEHDYIRVKYLDKEDIKSLGFGVDSRGDYSIGSYYISWHTGHERPIWVEITRDEGGMLFDGKIKNKSELKKLLIQLGIINE